jgi:molybdenum cofactor cytidylyltransferase
MLAAIILAGGESRRMGTAKALLPYHSQTFVEHLVEVTKHPRIGAQRVIVGAHAAQIRSQTALDPKIVIENSDWQSGQLSSIQAGIRSLQGTDTEGVMLCLVDHPLISSGVVDSLLKAFDRSHMPIVLPTFNSKRGHPLIFASRLYDELLAAPLDKGARVVVWNHSAEICEVPTDEEGVVMNLNDPDSFRYAVQSQGGESKRN